MSKILLDVPYFSQLDSETDQALRMCFSSSCSMMLNYINPNAIKVTGSEQKDDVYLRKLNSLGWDSTNPRGQLATLASYGIKATYHQNGTFADIDKQLKLGIPVPIGVLHHGNVNSPTGGGHWILVVGKVDDRYVVNDPAGEMDLVNGGYHISNNGKMVKYSAVNLGKRWMVEGNGSGWYIKGSR